MKRRVISEMELSDVSDRAEEIGFVAAISEFLGVGILSSSWIKERAIYYFANLPTGSIDRYFLSRAWFCAVSEHLSREGNPVYFVFPHIDLLVREHNNS